jgi:D-sedoheptulose 7-phosphate isomerase
MSADPRAVERITAALKQGAEAAARLMADRAALAEIAAAGAALARGLGEGRSVFACGNGGSMCDAMHFAEELSGRFRDDRRPLPVMAISDPGHLTCTANDFGYAEVFARFIEGHGRPGDLLVALSTSGKSPNIIRAAEAARARDLLVIALTGRAGSPVGALAHHHIVTPGGGAHADRVQELHMQVIHILVELVERRLFAENYPPPD